MGFLKTAAAGAAIAVFGLGSALAQTTPAPQKPPARPAQQQPAQGAPKAPLPGNGAAASQQNAGPTVVQVKAEPSQPTWTKVCGKDQAQNKEICYTTRDFVSDQGQPVLAVAVYDVKGDPTKIVRFLMPLGLLMQPGIRFAIDSATPVPGAFQICFPNGCFAEAQVKEDFVTAAKKGGMLNVSVQNQLAREVTFQIPMADFGKAFDGAPIDPKVLEEQQQKLQDELQKRGEEMRKRLEGSQGSAAPAPGAAPAPAAPKN